MFAISQSAAKSVPTWRLSTWGVLGAAFLGREHLDGLVVRADRLVELGRVPDRHDAVVTAVGDEEG
jgi:hypothetical protein